MAAGFGEVYRRLLRRYGPQHWWPAETPFEVMVGAVLTQNAAWINVEQAVGNLKAAKALDARAIAEADLARLGEWIRPSGYFNVKARRLQRFCQWFLDSGGLRGLRKVPTDHLRERLLGVYGIGPETADDILLYAFEREVFVIDAYTRRIFSRLDLITGEESYETLRQRFEFELRRSRNKLTVFNEYHALIVRHAKEHCRKRPGCEGCPLLSLCPGAQPILAKR